MGKFSFKWLGGRLMAFNLLAMLVVVILLFVGVNIAMSAYTHHGEKVEIPNLKFMSEGEAKEMLDGLGLTLVVSDTGYVKAQPAGAILEQRPAARSHVKMGRTVYVTINSARTPKLTIPDVIENSSRREAEARMKAMGFKMGEPRMVYGEKDWVTGVFVGSRRVFAGEKVSIDDVVSLEVGNGMVAADDSIAFVNADDYSIGIDDGVEEDPFTELP